MISPFEYQKGDAFRLRPLASNGHWRHHLLDFPVAFPGIFQDGNTALAEYFEPVSAGKAPLVVFIHGWGDHSAIPFKVMARGMAARGTHAVLLYLPFHSRRMPAEMKKRSPYLENDEWFAGYRIGVTDARQVLDWAETRPEIDPARMTVVGLSLGSFMGSIAMGIDQRVKAGVFIVSGGNATKITRLSRFSVFRRRYQLPQEQYDATQAQYAAYLQRVEKEGLENVEPPDRNFLVDALTYAHRLRNRPVLMLNAVWDEFIPRETTLEFQRACGECPLVWYPTTHSTIWAFYPSIAGRVQRFLGVSPGARA